MLSMTLSSGAALIVLETENLEKLSQGRPIKTPSGKTLIAWTPDAEWLSKQIAATDGDSRTVAKLVDESTKRPHKTRPFHEPTVTKLNGN